MWKFGISNVNQNHVMQHLQKTTLQYFLLPLPTFLLAKLPLGSWWEWVAKNVLNHRNKFCILYDLQTCAKMNRVERNNSKMSWFLKSLQSHLPQSNWTRSKGQLRILACYKHTPPNSSSAITNRLPRIARNIANQWKLYPTPPPATTATTSAATQGPWEKKMCWLKTCFGPLANYVSELNPLSCMHQNFIAKSRQNIES